MDDLGVRQQRPDHRHHGGGAEQQCLADAARVQQPVGEDVAAVEAHRRLDLIDGEAVDRHFDRHGLNGCHPVAGVGRHDPLFAGHQGHGAGADAGHDAAIDLAGEQPQRQADHAAAMRQHALDGKPGLAGIGGPEDRLERRGVGSVHVETRTRG